MTVWIEESILAGSTFAIDQAFILRMLPPAFDTASVDPDIRGVPHPLSSSEARIITRIAA